MTDFELEMQYFELVQKLIEEKKLLEETIKINAEKIAELEKENAELKTQNEKLKCCGNCSHIRYDYDYSFCELTKNGSCPCVNRDKWELRK